MQFFLLPRSLVRYCNGENAVFAVLFATFFARPQLVLAVL